MRLRASLLALALGPAALSPAVAAEDGCLPVIGDYTLQPGTERSSDAGGQAPGSGSFKYDYRHFELQRASCETATLKAFWTWLGERKYDAPRSLQRRPDGSYSASWRELHFELTLELFPTHNRNLARLRYTRKRWVFDGALSPVAWYEAHYLSPR